MALALHDFTTGLDWACNGPGYEGPPGPHDAGKPQSLSLESTITAGEMSFTRNSWHVQLPPCPPKPGQPGLKPPETDQN